MEIVIWCKMIVTLVQNDVFQTVNCEFWDKMSFSGNHPKMTFLRNHLKWHFEQFQILGRFKDKPLFCFLQIMQIT